MKTGIIAWMSMARALHDAFTTARMMKIVNRIALSNSKQKRMTAPVRYCRLKILFLISAAEI